MSVYLMPADQNSVRNTALDLKKLSRHVRDIDEALIQAKSAKSGSLENHALALEENLDEALRVAESIERTLQEQGRARREYPAKPLTIYDPLDEERDYIEGHMLRGEALNQVFRVMHDNLDETKRIKHDLSRMDVRVPGLAGETNDRLDRSFRKLKNAVSDIAMVCEFAAKDYTPGIPGPRRGFPDLF